jgi:hypothetical protein
MSYINFSQLTANKEKIRKSYRNASPYQYIYIDNFLTTEAINELRSDNSNTIASTNEQISSNKTNNIWKQNSWKKFT